MTELMSVIKNGEDVEAVLTKILGNLHSNGPIEDGDLEILSYIKLYQPELFLKHENTILNLMGLYFKQELSDVKDVRALIGKLYGQTIEEKHGVRYTPMQANLIENIANKRLFSFSSATSTGKSYVFRELILKQDGDMVVVVPSRALINEYFVKILEIVKGEKVNVLVFPDIVNTEMSDRNVFVLTPERVKDIFKIKARLNIKTILFDEAQLADDKGRRGIYFDSIVRRINESFGDAKLLFAQPYIDNPDAQFTRNKLTENGEVSNNGKVYPYRNVGKIFACIDRDGKYHHFAIDKERLGSYKIALDYDPISKCLNEKGSLLVYVSKASIYRGEALEHMSEYLDDLPAVRNENALNIINKISDLLGGSHDEQNVEHSMLLSLLDKGVVIHHGSLPLQARFLMEEYINKGFCRVCFATSTLYQGINMPFDMVYIKKFDSSKPLLVKNLIGRAGRSTNKPIYDYGQVILNYSNMSNLRNILSKKELMSPESQIDIDNADDDIALKEFKKAIREGTLNDDYNLTNSQVERLSSDATHENVIAILDILLSNTSTIDKVYRSLDSDLKDRVVDSFINIFKSHVGNRELSNGEVAVITNSIQIFMSQIDGRNLKSIIGSRFAYIAKTKERKKLSKLNYSAADYRNIVRYMEHNFTMPAEEIPNKNLPRYGLFDMGTKVTQVGYDRVMYDTYDYIDKIWGFCLSDIFHAAFDIYYKTSSDARANTMCKYIRYATIDDVEIWLLRYGFSFEEIEWIKPHVRTIDERRIEFGDLSDISEEQMLVLDRYLPDPTIEVGQQNG